MGLFLFRLEGRGVKLLKNIVWSERKGHGQ